MKILFFKAIIVSILFTGCSESKNSTEVPESQNFELNNKLDSVGEAFIEKGKVLGISVAIMEGNDTLYNNGFGYTDISKTNPVTNSTRFLMASISKLVGSTLVMKLVEEGKLSLDQTLFELLPEFPNTDQSKKITLRHMLSHTSGLQDYADEIDSVYVKTGVAPTKDDFFNFFRGRELFFEPGSNYSYCNSGYLFMGMIVERITGNDFQSEINRVINSTTQTSFKLIGEATKDPEMTSYAEFKGSSFQPYPHWTWIKGDGGLTASAIELAQFPRKWVNGEIITTELFQEMSVPVVLNDGIQTGYGLGVRNGNFLGERIIGHTGGHKSTYSIMVYFPEKDLTFVVFINTDNTPTSVRVVFAEFARIVLSKPIPDFSNKAIAEEDLSIYTGSYGTFDYKTDGKASIELNEDDNHLYYCIENDCVKMMFIGDHKFWIERWPYDYVEFHVDEEGNSMALKEFYTGYYAILRKKI